MYTQRSERNLRQTSEVERLSCVLVMVIKLWLSDLSEMPLSAEPSHRLPVVYCCFKKKKKKEEDTKNMTTGHCLFAKCLFADI